MDGGSAIAFTSSASHTVSHVTRVADLTLDEHRAATASITVTFSGSPARRTGTRAMPRKASLAPPPTP